MRRKNSRCSSSICVKIPAVEAAGVGEFDGFVEGLHVVDRDDGGEKFLVEPFRAVAHAAQHGGLDVEAVLEIAFAKNLAAAEIGRAHV